MDGTANITNPAPAGKSAPVLDAKGKVRLQKAVKDFEAIFMGMMMKSMRSTVPKDGQSGDSFGNDVMESLFDTEVAKKMAGRSNLGLAEMLYRSITNEPLPGAASAQSGKPGSLPVRDCLPSAPEGDAANASPSGISPASAPAPAAPQAHSGASRSAATTPRTGAFRQPPAQPGVWAAPSASTLDRIASYEHIIRDASQEHGVDTTMIKAVIAAESAGKANAVSAKDAKGLMQLTDTTAADMGVANVWNPAENIHGGTKYLQSLTLRFPGDTASINASYNAGPGRVEKHGGVPPIPETQAYVRRVMNYMKYFEKEEASNEGR
jgi:soluble lytic murein transglycosylase-like protein